jgi:hypothetical protein
VRSHPPTHHRFRDALQFANISIKLDDSLRERVALLLRGTRDSPRFAEEALVPSFEAVVLAVKSRHDAGFNDCPGFLDLATKGIERPCHSPH